MNQRKRGQPIITDPLTNEQKPKGVTQLTQPPEHLVQRPIATAAGYSEKVLASQQKLAQAKPPRMPMGHAEPIPAGKLAPLVQAAKELSMPKPDWGAPPEPPSEDVGEWSAPGTDESPPLMPGVGAGYAINQALASGKVKRPMNMREAAEFAQEQQEASKPDEAQFEPEEQAMPEFDTHEEERSDVEAELTTRQADEQLPLFGFNPMGQAQSPLMREERRKAIETRLVPLDITDLITKREIQQVIPIVVGKLAITMRTYRETEYLWVLQYLYEKTGVSSPIHTQEMTSMCRIVLSLVALNGRPLPDHREDPSKSDKIDKEKFEKKFEIVSSFPTPLLSDISIQYNWFQRRVDNLFDVESLKNG